MILRMHESSAVSEQQIAFFFSASSQLITNVSPESLTPRNSEIVFPKRESRKLERLKRPLIDSVVSIEFFQTNALQTKSIGARGHPEGHYGAVIFGRSEYDQARLLRVVLPMQNMAVLMEFISSKLVLRQSASILFKNTTRAQLLSRVESFAKTGCPIFDSNYLFRSGEVEMEGLTSFQKLVYENTCRIPHGETRSYKWLAERLRKISAGRAIGSALAANAFPLLIPCHRVIKNNGTIGGFMGENNPECWPLKLKRRFLELEGLHRQPGLFDSCL